LYGLTFRPDRRALQLEGGVKLQDMQSVFVDRELCDKVIAAETPLVQ
jgi:hypothetical protein